MTQLANCAPRQTGTWPWPDPLRYLACAWEACAAVRLPAADLNAMAQRRLESLVAFARRNSDFYRERYASVVEAGVVDLARLPVVTKAMMMERFDSLVTNPAIRRRAVQEFIADVRRVGQVFAGGCAVWTSSGTSGVPGIFLHDANALLVYDVLQLFRFRSQAVLMEFGTAPLPLERFALVAATGGHFAGVANVERLRSMYPWLAEGMRTLSLMQPLESLVDQLNGYRPSVVATYPSVAALLAQEQQAGRLHIEPVQVWTGGEQLSEATRRNVEAAFGADVREEYGASEFAAIGAGCPAGWLHVNADWVVLEAVDERNQPVPPGTQSHSVLMTNLANRVQPLIRYDLGDSITVRAEACECGSRLPAIRVHGRADDCLDFARCDGAAVRLLPLVLTTVLEEDAGVFDFQLVQCGPDELRLRLGIRQHAKAERARLALRDFLGTRGLDHVRVELAAEPPLRERAGAKLCRIVRAPAAGDPLAAASA